MTTALKLSEIQEKGFCNWCRNPLNAYTEKLTETNFIDVPGKKWGDGTKAQAVYCNECLPSEERKRQPKSSINRNTGAEVNIESLFDTAKEQKAVEKAKEETTTSVNDSDERTRSSKVKNK